MKKIVFFFLLATLLIACDKHGIYDLHDDDHHHHDHHDHHKGDDDD